MKKNQTFEKKVRAMTGKEIVMAMVKGLQKPKVKISMQTYGGQKDGVCYGCAATNTICTISKKVFTTESINGTSRRASLLHCDSDFLSTFELAINSLRLGEISNYNTFARSIGTARLEIDNNKLPILNDNYTKEQLQQYIDYANSLEK